MKERSGSMKVDKLKLPKSAVKRLVDWLISKELMSKSFAIRVQESINMAQFFLVETFQLEDLIEIEFKPSKSDNDLLVFKVFRVHQSSVCVDIFYNEITKDFKQTFITSEAEQLEILHIIRRILNLGHQPGLLKCFHYWESAQHRYKFLAQNPDYWLK